MKKKLLPFPFQIPGWFLIATGTVLLVCYLSFDFVIRVPVFAVWSAFLDTTLFTVIRTSVTEELIILCMLSGFLLILFSEERKERPRYRLLRIKAWIYAILTNAVFLFLSVLFVYGTGFIVILSVNIFSTMIFYLGFFHFFKIKEGKALHRDTKRNC